MNRKCFVVCPIGNEGTDIRKSSDQLFNYILKPVCDELNFECIRVDKINDNDSITETILDYLKNSDLVIADLSTHNPNAFFELGYRNALNKPVIQMIKDAENLPFDVKTIRTINYKLDDLDYVSQTKNRLKQTIENLKFSDTNDDYEENKQDFNSLILTELYSIQDNVKTLKKLLTYQNNSAVSILADKLQNAPKSTEEIIIQSIFSLFQNPATLQVLLDLSNKKKLNQNQIFESKSENIDESTS